jgi:glucokinase
MSDYTIGIDWGGSRIKVSAVSSAGTILESVFYRPPQDREIEEVVDGLIEQTATLVDRVGLEPLGVGLGLTGPVDPDFGVVLLPGKVKGLEQYPIVKRFKERFGPAVRAGNDGTVALYAERWIGHARDIEWATVITIGTGIGSGVMVEGRILEDPRFMFGTQLGHLVMDISSNQLCLTGARGTGEMLCSATALVLAVRSGLERGIPSTLTERYQAAPRDVDFRMIIEEGVEKSDRLCLDEMRRWTTRLGWLVVNAIHAYSSQVIILSGGATLAAKHFLPQIQAHVDRHIFRYPPGKRVPILVSEIQEHAGSVGAAFMCRQMNLRLQRKT